MNLVDIRLQTLQVCQDEVLRPTTTCPSSKDDSDTTDSSDAENSDSDLSEDTDIEE